MEKSRNIHPAYKKYDLEIKNSGELEEAKEIAGVSSHKEAMERFNKAEGEEEIKNIEKDEEIKSLKKEIEELKSQIEKMKESGFSSEDKEFFLNTELVKRSYVDFAKLLTEKINDNSTYAKNFNEYLINNQPFLEKLSEFEENPPFWFKIIRMDTAIIEIKNLFAEAQKLVKEILLETKSLSKDDEKLSSEDCYVVFIEKIMKMNNFNNFNNDVLKKVAEKLSEDVMVNTKKYDSLNLFGKYIFIELSSKYNQVQSSRENGSLNDKNANEAVNFIRDLERKLFVTHKNPELVIVK